jgi:hypothetical protein
VIKRIAFDSRAGSACAAQEAKPERVLVSGARAVTWLTASSPKESAGGRSGSLPAASRF